MCVYTYWHAYLHATLIFGDHVILLQTELGWLLLLQLHEDIQVLTKATLDISQSLKLQQVGVVTYVLTNCTKLFKWALSHLPKIYIMLSRDVVYSIAYHIVLRLYRCINIDILRIVHVIYSCIKLSTYHDLF